jgi:hypothetical protein
MSRRIFGGKTVGHIERLLKEDVLSRSRQDALTVGHLERALRPRPPRDDIQQREAAGTTPSNEKPSGATAPAGSSANVPRRSK